eukprot:gnl/TRDRNA2_/TRDRNA2_135683_c1_seq2.p1 gnl/TRDRNA2_/TRDRNA2_135683_c1~~gnl/TRDRNA2_/TRDRNA2_135683_c1_seq2.p1  ORF type:complete len:117 (+),score=14.87 gnl/TRDRNA2_/TRDRNA2_135683_c1_seq2:96-446(+)
MILRHAFIVSRKNIQVQEPSPVSLKNVRLYRPSESQLSMREPEGLSPRLASAASNWASVTFHRALGSFASLASADMGAFAQSAKYAPAESGLPASGERQAHTCQLDSYWALRAAIR